MCRKNLLNRPDNHVSKHGIMLLTLLLAFLCFSGGFDRVFAAADVFPFAVGEKLTYRASLGPLAVGAATIEVRAADHPTAPGTYHFVMETRTNNRINWLYRIRETQESWVDGKMTRSLAYRKRDTGTHPRDVVVRFDWQAMQASYRNVGKDEKTSPLVPGTFDPLALFFVLRTRPLRVGDTIEIPISDGKKLVRASAKVAKRERIVIDGKVHDTFLVIPDLKPLNKALGDKDAADMMIWFGMDESRFPMKIVSRFNVGSFILELVSAETGGN